MSKNTIPSLQDNDALLTYRVGPVLCCGPTLPVISITPPPPLTHLPGTNTAEPGIFKHGSYVVSATDLRYRFGVKEENWNQPGQVIIAQHGDLTRGYFVDEIKDVIHFPQTGWGQLPAYLPRGIFSRTLLLDKQIYLYADFEKLSQLQGSGYLAEYISHLEKIELKNSGPNDNSTAKTHKDKVSRQKSNKITEDKQSENVKVESKRKEETIREPLIEKGNISNIKTAKDTTASNYQSKTVSANLNTEKIASKDQSITSSQVTESVEKSSPNKLNHSKLNFGKPKTKDRDDENNSIEKTEPISSNIETTKKPIKPNQHKKTASTENKVISHNQSVTKNKEQKINASSDIVINKVPKKETNKRTNEKHIPIDNSSSAERENEKEKNKTTSLNTQQPETDSSYAGLLFLIVLLLIGASGGYYYISRANTDNDITDKTSPYINEAPPEIRSSIINDSTSPLDTIKNNTEAVNLLENVKDEPFAQASNTEKENSEYHASIKQDSTTITIELDGPLPPKIKNLTEQKMPGDSELNLNETNVNIKNTFKENPEKNLSEPEQPEKTIKSSSKIKPENKQQKSIEIIHHIVKDDTLWAIAKRYLKNPFRYPELAKLSKIRNPDLIYPGNRVRIIYKNSKKK